MTAVKFDRQAGYNLPNHSSMACCVLDDFHGNGGACSTGNSSELRPGSLSILRGGGLK